MRIDDKIRSQPILCERHVLLHVGDTNCTFLTMARCKLVTNLGNLGSPCADLHEFQALNIGREKDLINETTLGATQRRGDIALNVQLRSLSQLLGVRRDRGSFADDDVVTCDANARGNNSIVVELVVGTTLHA